MRLDNVHIVYNYQHSNGIVGHVLYFTIDGVDKYVAVESAEPEPSQDELLRMLEVLRRAVAHV